MRAIDYETKRIHTVNPFFSVFLRHISRVFQSWAFVLVSWSWVRKGIGSSLSRLVRTTASSPLRLTCEPSSPINAFSHILFYRRSKLIILENRNLSFFDQKIKKNSSKHCVWKIEVCEFLWIPSKRLRRINEKNQFIERIVWLSIKTNKQT